MAMKDKKRIFSGMGRWRTQEKIQSLNIEHH